MRKIPSHKSKLAQPIRTDDRTGSTFRGTAAQRGYDHHWRKLRRSILNRDPICRRCRTAGSSEVDHIVPKSKGGTNHPSNLQGLCKSCHSRKSRQEDDR